MSYIWAVIATLDELYMGSHSNTVDELYMGSHSNSVNSYIWGAIATIKSVHRSTYIDKIQS